MSLLVKIQPLSYPAEAHDKSIPAHARQELKARLREEYATYRQQCLVQHRRLEEELEKALEAELAAGEPDGE